jgi:hypothetical protein
MIGAMVCLLISTVGFIHYAPIMEPRELGRAVATPMLSTGSTSILFTHRMSLSEIIHKASFAVLSPVLHFFRPPLLWGAYAGDEVYSASLFESFVGRTMDLQPVFVGWYELFPSRYGPSVRDQQKTLVVFWEQYDITLGEIIDGRTDEYIDAFANAAKAYNGPVILAPLHEMNGDWAPWSGALPGNSPEKVIAAWRHIHDRFAGISNVQFAWNVNNGSQPDTPQNAIAQYYPGDAYVDYVAVNGFNNGDPWQSWSDVFGGALKQLRIYRKPIYILSMASAQGTAKAEWITDALTVQIPRHPEIVGWIWFNANKEENWLVNSDERSFAAFKRALSNK